ncbi:MAG: hypothetical protein Kow0020_02070 [Wenzhouxiangellaceae bacterium]
MTGIGFSELLMLGLVALIVVGPRRLPEMARMAGHLVREARRGLQSLQSGLQAELDREHNRRIMEAHPDEDRPAEPESGSDRDRDDDAR